MGATSFLSQSLGCFRDLLAKLSCNFLMTLVMVPGSSQDLFHPSSPAFNPSLTCHEILGICEGIASPVSANHALDHQLLEELGVTPVNGPHFGISRLPCGQSNTGLDIGGRPTHHFSSITTAFLQQHACRPQREKNAILSANFGNPGLSDILCNASTRNTTLSARCKFKACPTLQFFSTNHRM